MKRRDAVQAELLGLARVSVAAAKGREAALRREVRAALRAGATPARLDEALLQLVPFAGYARAINAFRILQQVAPHVPVSRPRGADVRRRGERLCRRIYGPVYPRMIARMRSYHPDLAEWIVSDGYGRVLSRPGLSIRERELIVVAVLTALKVPLQLRSHVEGARRVGASDAEIRAVLDL
jgi:alkylhydroperoxidase/carboxymuconolactone decarboxylase family protein YurZ